MNGPVANAGSTPYLFKMIGIKVPINEAIIITNRGVEFLRENLKNKIVDGIKVVILIAAGVLALGLAFKIIGKVDFLSVMALSAAMYVISNTFSKISSIKNL